MKNEKSCAILGHRPMRFAWGFDEDDPKCNDLKITLAQAILELVQQGINRFYVPCDPGVGLYSSEIVNCLRDNHPELLLFCMPAYEEQATKWTPQLRDRYFDALVKCTHIDTVSIHKTPTALLDAYQEAISRSDYVLAVYDPQSYCGDSIDQAILFATKCNKILWIIHPDTLERSIPTSAQRS